MIEVLVAAMLIAIAGAVIVYWQEHPRRHGLKKTR